MHDLMDFYYRISLMLISVLFRVQNNSLISAIQTSKLSNLSREPIKSLNSK